MGRVIIDIGTEYVTLADYAVNGKNYKINSYKQFCTAQHYTNSNSLNMASLIRHIKTVMPSIVKADVELVLPEYITTVEYKPFEELDGIRASEIKDLPNSTLKDKRICYIGKSSTSEICQVIYSNKKVIDALIREFYKHDIAVNKAISRETALQIMPLLFTTDDDLLKITSKARLNVAVGLNRTSYTVFINNLPVFNRYANVGMNDVYHELSRKDIPLSDVMLRCLGEKRVILRAEEVKKENFITKLLEGKGNSDSTLGLDTTEKKAEATNENGDSVEADKKGSVFSKIFKKKDKTKVDDAEVVDTRVESENTELNTGKAVGNIDVENSVESVENCHNLGILDGNNDNMDENAEFVEGSSNEFNSDFDGDGGIDYIGDSEEYSDYSENSDGGIDIIQDSTEPTSLGEPEDFDEVAEYRQAIDYVNSIDANIMTSEYFDYTNFETAENVGETNEIVVEEDKEENTEEALEEAPEEAPEEVAEEVDELSKISDYEIGIAKENACNGIYNEIHSIMDYIMSTYEISDTEITTDCKMLLDFFENYSPQYSVMTLGSRVDKSIGKFRLLANINHKVNTYMAVLGCIGTSIKKGADYYE